MIRAEDERAVCLDALVREARNCLEAVLAHRNLDDDVGRELGEMPALFEHPLDVVGDDLGRYRPGRDLADLLEDRVV